MPVCLLALMAYQVVLVLENKGVNRAQCGPEKW